MLVHKLILILNIQIFCNNQEHRVILKFFQNWAKVDYVISARSLNNTNINSAVTFVKKTTIITTIRKKTKIRRTKQREITGL